MSEFAIHDTRELRDDGAPLEPETPVLSNFSNASAPTDRVAELHRLVESFTMREVRALPRDVAKSLRSLDDALSASYGEL